MGITGRQLAEKAEIAYREKWGYIWATAGETWTEAKQAAFDKKYYSDTSKYADYKQGVLYGKKWFGKKVTDCSGLVKWAMKQLGVTSGIYHGSNSQFSKNCYMTGKIVKGTKIPVGALIFTGDTVGQHNHVGILVDEKTVCEAKGTTAGIVHTALSNRKWTWWGLLRGVTYEELQNGTTKETDKTTTTVAIKTAGKVVKRYATLRRGAKGDAVTKLQTLLAKDGSNLKIDGIFGIGTLSAVKAFQKRHNLEVDGIVGPKTWAELLKLEDQE